MSYLEAAIKKLYQYVDTRVDGVRPFRAIVTGQSSGMVQIRRIHATTAETALRARCRGFDLATNDEVLCLPMADGLPVVVEVLQRASPSSYTLTPDLILSNDLTVGGEISTDDILTNGLNITGIFEDSSDAGYSVSAGAAMGSSPGSITKTGNEYCGRIIQDTGSSGVTTGIMWTVTFANNRPNSNYNVFLNPQNANSAAVRAYAINDSSSQFTIRCQTAPGTSQEMRIGWWIVQR